jgi:hypothetical protein
MPPARRRRNISGIPPAILSLMSERKREVVELCKKGHENDRELGMVLSKTKKALKAKGRGYWMKFKKSLPMSARRAEMLIRIVEHPVLGDPEYDNKLPPSWTTKNELSAIPANDLIDLITNVKVDPKTELKEAKKLAAPYRKNGKHNEESKDDRDEFESDDWDKDLEALLDGGTSKPKRKEAGAAGNKRAEKTDGLGGSYDESEGRVVRRKNHRHIELPERDSSFRERGQFVLNLIRSTELKRAPVARRVNFAKAVMRYLRLTPSDCGLIKESKFEELRNENENLRIKDIDTKADAQRVGSDEFEEDELDSDDKIMEPVLDE